MSTLLPPSPHRSIIPCYYFLFFSRAETASLEHILFFFLRRDRIALALYCYYFVMRPHRSNTFFSSYFFSCRDRIARAHIFFLFSYRDHAAPFPQDAMFFFFLQSEYSLFVCLPFFYLITSPIDFSIFSIVKFVLIHRSQILNEKKLLILHSTYLPAPPCRIQNLGAHRTTSFFHKSSIQNDRYTIRVYALPIRFFRAAFSLSPFLL